MLEVVFYIVIVIAALGRYHWRNRDAAIPVVDPDDFAACDKLISMHITYYRTLSEVSKKRFVQRVLILFHELRVEGREEFEVTAEVRILVCASLTQLTFGFSEPGLPFIKGVLVFPGVFYSRLARNWVKGLAMNNGVVFLSWPDFMKGYEHSSDTYNLGLHEFTHMLKMQSEDGFMGDRRLTEHYETWNEIAHEVFLRTREKSETFFREYAGTNTSEFLSVCVENFFEIPEAFEKELPEIYYHLCYLLNQDPLNKTGDYVLTEACIQRINAKIKNDLPLPKTLISSGEYRFWLFVSRFTLGILFIDFIIVMQTSLPAQLAVLRMVLATFFIFLLSRWVYYKNLRDAFHISYLKYFGGKLLPLLLVIMFLVIALT